MSVVVTSTCKHCGGSVDPHELIPLLIEPLYDLDVSVLLIPMPMETLRKFLTRHSEKFKKRYRLQGRTHRKIRLLSLGEIRLIRSMAFRGDGSRADEMKMAKALMKAL